MNPQSRAQIVATIGPSCATEEMIYQLAVNGMDIVRLNFSWGTYDEHRGYIRAVRSVEQRLGKSIPVFIDLPGPRIQHDSGHTYDKAMIRAITDTDKEHIAFGVKEGVDHFGVSFVGSAADIADARAQIAACGGVQRIIAKIERQVAVDSLAEIVAATDAVMIARGDLGDEVPFEKIPFIEVDIINACRAAGKPVITATQMLLSMTEHERPTRAEVTDVAYAVLHGSDVIMLSDETARGKYPVQAVTAMNQIACEAEKHIQSTRENHPLVRTTL